MKMRLLVVVPLLAAALAADVPLCPQGHDECPGRCCIFDPAGLPKPKPPKKEADPQEMALITTRVSVSSQQSADTTFWSVVGAMLATMFAL